MTQVINLAEIRHQQGDEWELTQDMAFLTFMGSLMNDGVELKPNEYDLVAEVAGKVAGHETILVYEEALPKAA